MRPFLSQNLTVSISNPGLRSAYPIVSPLSVSGDFTVPPFLIGGAAFGVYYGAKILPTIFWDNLEGRYEGGPTDSKFYGINLPPCEAFNNACRTISSGGTPVLIKLNTHDHTPAPGMTPGPAVRYAQRPVEMGIDGIEPSSGTAHYSFMHMCRGDVPVEELVRGLPFWKRPSAAFTGKAERRENPNSVDTMPVDRHAWRAKPAVAGTVCLVCD